MAGAATVEKALDVLFHLHEAAVPLGLSEIGRALDLPKSSCHRLLASLAKREMVERDEVGHYRPGLALLSLGIGAQAREPVVRAARPILEVEATAFAETVFVVGRRRGRLIVLDKCEGTGFLRAAPGVGDVVPEDVTASGKLYRIFDEGFAGARGVGRDPLVDSVMDAREQEDVRRCGYALNRDAWIDGLSVLAVPIWQAEGKGEQRIVATLALAAASARFDAIGEEAVAERLLAAAGEIGGRLGSSNGRFGRERASMRRRGDENGE